VKRAKTAKKKTSLIWIQSNHLFNHRQCDLFLWRLTTKIEADQEIKIRFRAKLIVFSSFRTLKMELRKKGNLSENNSLLRWTRVSGLS
jgi:hypothetical protein